MLHIIQKLFGGMLILGLIPAIDDLHCHDGSIEHTDRDKTEALNKSYDSYIDPGKSPYPDGCPLLALKETAEQICTILFIKSLEFSILPQEWSSNTSFFKKGNLPNNYQPITVG